MKYLNSVPDDTRYELHEIKKISEKIEGPVYVWHGEECGCGTAILYRDWFEYFQLVNMRNHEGFQANHYTPITRIKLEWELGRRLPAFDVRELFAAHPDAIDFVVITGENGKHKPGVYLLEKAPDRFEWAYYTDTRDSKSRQVYRAVDIGGLSDPV